MLAVEPADQVQTSPNIAAGLRGLGAPFRRFFFVALFFDIGFGLYFFLIYLYLMQAHFHEKTIGIAAGALTVGNIVATIPIGFLARRIGLRPMLMGCFIAAPLCGAARIIVLHPGAQIALAFAQGVAMCSYTVCFAPAIAALTTPENRTTAFSLTFGTGIGSGVVCGLLGGAAPNWLRHAHPSLTQTSGMACVLSAGCAIALLSVIPLIRLEFPLGAALPAPAVSAITGPFARRFLTMIAVWNGAIGAFAPFANIYLSGPLRMPLPRIGIIFSSSQLLQVGGVLTAPLLYRRIGKEHGIAALQLGAAAAVIALYAAHGGSSAIVSYLCLSMFQYMCNPAIYSLLMDRTQEDLRATASAMQNLVTCCALAASAALAGLMIASHGYGALFLLCACLSTIGAVLTCRMKQDT